MKKNMRKSSRIICAFLGAMLMVTACSTSGANDVNNEKNAGNLPDEAEISIKQVELSTAPAEIFVEAIPDMPGDFILGADMSTLIAQEKSGVKYYDENGNEADPLLTLARNGVNTIRIRVWNDPYDENGNGYGGGNNDVATAIEIGKRATEYGMGVMIDFHYSDFWADPAKQMVPKAWEGMTPEEKGVAAEGYTYESLKQMLDAGVNVTMVQIGNETTNGLSGENKWSAMTKIMEGGSVAIRKISEEYRKDILIVAHFTNPEDTAKLEKCAQMLWKFEIDYDVFASSYYPFWHGTTENLTNILTKISEQYNKKVMVAEISYAYTMEDGDGFGNTISEDAVCELPYAITVQGQADCIRDVTKAVVDVGDAGIGIMYWEPAWIPVKAVTQADREGLWNKYGSGWASVYSKAYDPDDAGKYYGGSAWDNQALFDFDGKPLPSISVFRFLKSGAETEKKIDSVNNVELKVRIDDEIVLPETVTAAYNNGDVEEVPVAWNTTGIIMDNTKGGEYTVSGTAKYNKEEFDVTCHIKVVEKNYIENPSFEDEDISMWVLNNIDDVTTELFVSDKAVDAIEGGKSMHFYSTKGVDFTMEQTITNLKPGIYKYSMGIHGGNARNQVMEIYAIADGKEYTMATGVTAWQEVSYPAIDGIVTTDGTIVIGVRVKCDAGAWGNLDEFLLAPVE